MTEPFTCPFCAAISHNPNDAIRRYCGRCHLFVDDVITFGMPYIARGAPLETPLPDQNPYNPDRKSVPEPNQAAPVSTKTSADRKRSD